MTKRCRGCETEKPLAEFHKDNRRGDGRRARCKDCESKARPTYLGLPKCLGLPDDVSISVKASVPFGTARSVVAVEFVRAHPEATWGWMDVPANARSHRWPHWWSLTVRAKVDGVWVELDGGAGFTTEQAKRLTAEMQTAGDGSESRTPAPFVGGGYAQNLLAVGC